MSTLILSALGALWRVWDGQGFSKLDRVYRFRVTGVICLSIISTLFVSGFNYWALPLAAIPVISLVASPYKFMPTQKVTDWFMLCRFSVPAAVYTLGLFLITGKLLTFYVAVCIVAGAIYILSHRLYEDTPGPGWREKFSRYGGEIATGFSAFFMI